jgi:hypothetical protein
VITELTWVRIDDLGHPSIDAIATGSGAARTWSVGQPLPEVQFAALVEPIRPVIDRPAADAEGVRDLLGGLAFIEPQQGLGTASLLGHGIVGGEVLQLQALPGRESEQSHRSTLRKETMFDDSL